MKPQLNLNRLKRFLGGYFHEDWELEATEPDEAVSAFLQEGWTSAELHELSNGRRARPFLLGAGITKISKLADAKQLASKGGLGVRIE